MSKESKEISEYLEETGFSAWVEHPDYGSYTDEYVNWLEKQTQPLKDEIKLIDINYKRLEAYNRIAKTEIAELKESNTWVSVEELPKESCSDIKIFIESEGILSPIFHFSLDTGKFYDHNDIECDEYYGQPEQYLVRQPLPTPPKQDELCNCPPLDVTTFDSDLPCDWCTTCGKKI